MANPWITLFRDGETLGGDVIRGLVAIDIPYMQTPSGVGTGFVNGQVLKSNGRGNIATPNHFFVTADGVTKVITIQPGIYYVQKDSGLVSFNPEVITICLTQSLTFTVPNNAQGTSRTDTICLRIDQSTAPDSTGSNLPSIVDVQGGASNALGNAPSDGTLYVPICLIVLSNNFTFITQGNITDKRLPAWTPNHPWKARMHASGAVSIPNGGGLMAFDTADYDPNGNLITGAGASYTVPVAGIYFLSSLVEFTTSGASALALTARVNGADTVEGRSDVTGASTSSPSISTAISLAVGQIITINLFQNSGVALNTVAGTVKSYFSIHLLSLT